MAVVAPPSFKSATNPSTPSRRGVGDAVAGAWRRRRPGATGDDQEGGERQTPSHRVRTMSATADDVEASDGSASLLVGGLGSDDVVTGLQS